MNKSLCPICSSSKKEFNKFCSYTCRNKGRIWTDSSKKRLSNSVKNSIDAKYIHINVECISCGKKSSIRIYKTAKQKKFFCSIKCSKSRKHTAETKTKISDSLKKRSQSKLILSDIPRNCKRCSKIFFSKKKTQTFCSRSCASKHSMSLLENREKSRERMKETLKGLSIKRRSKNEELFYDLCVNEYGNVKNNEAMFNGWDADIILPDYKIAILWNGKWHYEKITEKHSVNQVQTRDKIKLNAIKNFGWIPYTIKDMGKYNPVFVRNKFEEFKQWLIIQICLKQQT